MSNQLSSKAKYYLQEFLTYQDKADRNIPQELNEDLHLFSNYEEDYEAQAKLDKLGRRYYDILNKTADNYLDLYLQQLLEDERLQYAEAKKDGKEIEIGGCTNLKIYLRVAESLDKIPLITLPYTTEKINRYKRVSHDIIKAMDSYMECYLWETRADKTLFKELGVKPSSGRWTIEDVRIIK